MRDVVLPDPATAAIPVIANASAGGGHSGEALESLRQLFAAHGIMARVHATRADPAAAVREALRDDPPVVVAAGGDGTVSAVAHALRGRDCALAVIPLGTSNHFAKDLGIPLDPAEAVRLLVDGRRIDVDVGEVNGRSFVNNSSLGLYPGMVRDRTRQQRRLGRGKRMAMLWALLAALRRAPLLTIRMQLERDGHEARSPFVFIGNNEYAMEGFDIGTRARLDAGHLSVYTTHRSTAGGLAVLALRALLGRLRQAEDFAALTARRLRVETPHARLLVATDGELNIMETPLEFRIVPRALSVLVPRARE